MENWPVLYAALAAKQSCGFLGELINGFAVRRKNDETTNFPIFRRSPRLRRYGRLRDAKRQHGFHARSF
jgi:hypothetical protein